MSKRVGWEERSWSTGVCRSRSAQAGRSRDVSHSNARRTGCRAAGAMERRRPLSGVRRRQRRLGRGGAPTRPLGRLAAGWGSGSPGWVWSPTGHRLAGVSVGGGVARRRAGRGNEAAVAGRLGRDEHRLVAERADARGVTLALPEGAASLPPGDLAARPAQRHQDAAVPPRKARHSAALAVRLLAGWALAARLGRQPELGLARRRRGAADRTPGDGRQSRRGREGDAHLRRLRLLVHRQPARLRARQRRPPSHAERPDQLRRAAAARGRSSRQPIPAREPI